MIGRRNQPALMAQLVNPWPYRGILGRCLDKARMLAGELRPMPADVKARMRSQQRANGRCKA